MTKPVDDMPFDALISVRYRIQGRLGQWIDKEAKSTMFPKNWDLERIQQEVAFVYENTVGKKRGRLPKRQPTEILDKYEYNSLSGFSIIIEVDGKGMIKNAYPNKK